MAVRELVNPIVNFGDQVFVTNLGTHRLTYTYANRNYTLIPNEKTIVPVEAAILWFGDPRSGENAIAFEHGGQVGWLPDRYTEVRRLRSRLGLCYGDDRTFYDNGIDPQTKQPFGYDDNGEPVVSPKVPVVKVETMLGAVVPMVIDDPLGETVNPESQTIAQRAAQEQIIQSQQAQIDALIRFVEDQTGEKVPLHAVTAPLQEFPVGHFSDPPIPDQPPHYSTSGPPLPEDE